MPLPSIIWNSTNCIVDDIAKHGSQSKFLGLGQVLGPHPVTVAFIFSCIYNVQANGMNEHNRANDNTNKDQKRDHEELAWDWIYYPFCMRTLKDRYGRN